MKTQFLMVISFLFISISCAQNTEDKNVKIKYDNKINGYDVEVIWTPKTVNFTHVIGPAIITFKNHTSNKPFNLTANNFGILMDRLPFSYAEENYKNVLSNIPDQTIQLTYKTGTIDNIESFGTIDEPFYFQDLDFDGKEELIIAEVGTGPRDLSLFKVYNFYEGVFNPEHSNITYKTPFIHLDEMSQIDMLNKKISIFNDAGVCAYRYDVYALQESENPHQYNEYILDTILQHESDENNDCYELEYRIINGEKIFISKTLFQ